MGADEESALRVVGQFVGVGGQCGGVDDVDLGSVDPHPLDGRVGFGDAGSYEDGCGVVVGVVEHAVEVVGRTVGRADAGHDRESAHEREVELFEARECHHQACGRLPHQLNRWGVVTRHGRPSPSLR